MPLLEPDVLKITPDPSEPASDRAPEWVAGGTPEPMRSELVGLLGEDRVLARASDIIRYASDASPYRKLPKVVIMAKSDEDIGKVIGYGRENGIGVTFRAGGSSLNGQGQTEGILVDVRRHFGGIEVLDDGRSVSAAPGAMLGDVNRVLAPYGFKLGPDPASTEIATIGGVVANNSGGMKCGTKFDSYSTVTGMTFILPSGTVVDSTAPDAEEKFADAEPELAAGLLKIREEILADEELADRIRRKFEIKNTTGYRLCAFLDAETPVEIYRRLMIGSEGTLGFISRVIFDTVPIPKKTTLAWIHFPDIPAAIDPVPDLVAAGATAVELMVAPALIYLAWNVTAADGAPSGWAIPTATDIAFAVAILAVISTHLPAGLRTFLLTLAVVDDLLAITIIALFYTEELDLAFLGLGLLPILLFALLVQKRIFRGVLLIPLALIAWVLVHESGVHATVAGVLLGITVQVLRRDEDSDKPGLAEHL